MIDTKVINTNSQDLALAAKLLQDGELVAIPTETVYGLAANALDSNAVSKIFKAKGRPSDNPLIVHIGSLEQLPSLIHNISSSAKTLIQHFWPGPLTLVFRSSQKVPNIVNAGLTTVAIRYPKHPITTAIINLSGVPLAAPSANISGRPSPTNAKRVFEDLSGRIPLIVDGGSGSVGLESTVVDVTGTIPIILRPGKITQSMMERYVGRVDIDKGILQNNNPKSPGMKYAHYCPNATVYIVEGRNEDVIQTIDNLIDSPENKNKKIGVMATDESLNKYNPKAEVISVGSRLNLDTVAHSLFETLRTFDDLGVDIIYSESFPQGKQSDIRTAIMNRLMKAANHNVINA